MRINFFWKLNIFDSTIYKIPCNLYNCRIIGLQQLCWSKSLTNKYNIMSHTWKCTCSATFKLLLERVNTQDHIEWTHSAAKHALVLLSLGWSFLQLHHTVHWTFSWPLVSWILINDIVTIFHSFPITTFQALPGWNTTTLTTMRKTTHPIHTNIWTLSTIRLKMRNIINHRTC